MGTWDSAARRKFKITSENGKEWTGWCPVARHSKPTLSVNTDKGVWFCQACGHAGSFRLSGDLPDIRMDDVEAKLRSLQIPVSKVMPKEGMLTAYDNPHPYWTERGFSDETIRLFQLGYDFMEDVMTIPVRSHHGKLVGVITRRLDGAFPKYKHPEGMRTSKMLFGSWLFNGRKKVALVEGPVDAIACWDSHVPAGGLFGSRISEFQRRILIELGVEEVVIMTDNDKAGDDAVEQIHDMLGGVMQLSVMQYRSYWNAKDPGELTAAQRKKGFHSAIPWHRYQTSV